MSVANNGRPGAATRAVRAAVCADAEHGAVIPPIHLSSTFSFDGFGGKRRYDYTRSGNPTRDQLACAIAELEHGAGAVVTATGMAAVTLVLQLVRAGERVVAPVDCYGGTHRLLSSLARRGLLVVDFVAMHAVEDDGRPAPLAGLRSALAAGAKLVWVETPSNPLLRITDIGAVAALAHDHGALVVADNTFLSPVLQQPLALGADVVVHSTTKYLNGHSDVVGGAVVARDPSLVEELAWWANCLGITGAPFDSFLTLRGIRTLHPRIRAHLENTDRLARLLAGSEAVGRTWYPGLATHPGHAIAARQQTGFGAVVSFALRGGEPAVRAFLDGLRWVTLAESLGGVESLIAHPATMTHASMTAEARAAAGISDALLRLSVGIEDPEDLIADLTAALSGSDHL